MGFEEQRKVNGVRTHVAIFVKKNAAIARRFSGRFYKDCIKKKNATCGLTLRRKTQY